MLRAVGLGLTSLDVFQASLRPEASISHTTGARDLGPCSGRPPAQRAGRLAAAWNLGGCGVSRLQGSRVRRVNGTLEGVYRNCIGFGSQKVLTETF